MSADDESAPPELRRKKKARKSSAKKKSAEGTSADRADAVRTERFYESRNVRFAVLVALVGLYATAEYFDYPLQQKPLVAILGVLVLVALTAGAIRQIVQSKPDAPAARPPFAKSWPDDASLAPLLQAFEAGNFAFVREHAPKVAVQTKDPAIRAAAQELRRRIEPSPTSLYLWLLGVVLVVFLYGYFLSHAH